MNTVCITETAANKLRALMDSETETPMALRIAVRPGGCSGYSYEMCFDNDTTDTDEHSEQHGITIVIDPASAQLLTGATLDYTDNLNNSGFKIENPNATRSCGCGQSFS